MAYKARFSRTFLKKEKKMPKQIKDRIAEAVKQILIDPYRGVSLIGDLKGLWRHRVGEYRIIYEINEKEKLVTFHFVKLRKKVYQ